MPDSPRARLRRARSSLASGDAETAASILSELGRGSPPGEAVRIDGLLARALAELHRFDEALEAADRAAASGDPDPGRLARAEVLIWAQRLDEAREALDPVREDNIVRRGFRDALSWLAPDRSANGAGGSQSRPYEGDPAALWFEPVLAVVLLFLESRLRGRPPSPQLHALHCGFFQPDLRHEAIPPTVPGVVERCVLALRGSSARARARRAREVYAHYRRDDLESFGCALEEWIDQEPRETPDAHPLEDTRTDHLLKSVFLRGQFEDYIESARRLRKGLEDEALELGFHLRMIYAKMASGRQNEARRELARRVRAGELQAASAHLLGKLELAEHPERAAAWFRRAFAADDVSMVELARMELDFLGWKI